MTVYLVTGAAGFIGANYVHFLRDVEPDATVVGIDYLGFASNIANLADAGPRFSFEQCDISDADRIAAVYEEHRPDYVVNFAAESHNDRAIDNPGIFTRSNALGAQTLAEASRRHGIQTHVHVSTIEVYGELAAGAHSFDEASPLNAKTPYSAAKAAGDLLVRAYMHTYPELDLRMTHCANNYGPYQLPEKLLPLAITNVLRGRKVPIYGDGKQSRDWLHVMDHCRAIHAILHADRRPIPAEAAVDPSLLPIYDISARQEVVNLDLMHMILERLGVDPEDHIEFVADRPNHDRRYIIEPKKLEDELGWSPQVDLDTGLTETVAWYVDHRDWWEQIFAEKGELQIEWAKHQVAGR
jgi:dTDP-glucose 4,6-dehydratase